MKRNVILFSIVLLITVIACARVNPPVENASASFNYGKQLLNEGKIALAIVEFKKALAFYDSAGYTFSAFGVYPYIARGYYLSGDADEAIATYFEALTYAKDHKDAVGDNELAGVMRELAGLLVQKNRIDEARYLLNGAAELYNKTGNDKSFLEVTRELDEL
jgi:tetratricopeptide (TPR) repeat protein